MEKDNNINSPEGKRPENKMGVMPVHGLLLSMSIPMVIAMIVQAMYNIVDSIFVAQISENALTAVSLAFPIQSLMIGVGIGTGVGVNAFLSKSLGEKNYEFVNRSAMNGLFLSWLSCAVFMLVGLLSLSAFFRTQTNISEIVGYGHDYLSVICALSFGMFNQIILERLLISTGKTFYSMISQTVGAVTNIILDPIMIFGLLGFPRLGVSGAAIATVTGQFAGAALALYFNLTKNHEIKLGFKGFRPSYAIIRRIYAVGLPSILMGSVGSIMTYGLNALLISFTATAVAVFGVYFKLQSFIFMPIFGLNNGVVPIIAYNFGARKKERIVSVIKLGLMYAVGIMTAGTAIFQFFPVALLRQFNATPEMMAIGVPALRVISSHFIFAAFCILCLSVFQALGNGMDSLIVAVLRQIFLLLPIAWLLSLSGSVNAIWWSFPITEFVTLVLCAVLIKRVYDRKIKTMQGKAEAPS
ncbi:MAG: MATE family efflux transporter [Synergistaceae bacterium]|jgi:putative MATE family efflux protein|nr:MATE family efflux transporter [Synergistaceae bacterium]